MANALNQPSVSVVIPTIGRPSVRQAVLSVLSQIEVKPEVLVVLDDPSRQSHAESLLHDLACVLITTDKQGAPAARNAGLRIATGDYIGFLDDDDEWLPNKARDQIIAIENSNRPLSTISVTQTEFIRAGGKSVRCNPSSTTFKPGRFTEQLVSRTTLRYRGSYFSTPTLLAPSSLSSDLKWDENLPKHQDWDLFARLIDERHVALAPVSKPLVRVHQGSPQSISASKDWRHGAVWLRKHDAKLAGRGRADFILLHILLHALNSKSLTGLRFSLRNWDWGLPHLGALFRFLAGLATRR